MINILGAISVALRYIERPVLHRGTMPVETADQIVHS